MKCYLAVCSEAASLDAGSNLLSIFNIFEEFESQTFPIVIPKISVIFVIKKEEAEANNVDGFIVFTLNGQEVIRNPFTLDFEGKKRLRVVLVVTGLVLSAPGTFHASLLAGEEELTKWEIEVRQLNVPQPKLEIAS